MDQKDLEQIKELFNTEFDLQEKRSDEKLDLRDKLWEKKLDLRDKKLDIKLPLMIRAELTLEMGKMEQKMFDWKSEIIDSVDAMAKEIRDEREFRDISAHQTTDNSKRIEKLEKKVFGVSESGV